MNKEPVRDPRCGGRKAESLPAAPGRGSWRDLPVTRRMQETGSGKPGEDDHRALQGSCQGCRCRPCRGGDHWSHNKAWHCQCQGCRFIHSFKFIFIGRQKER